MVGTGSRWCIVATAIVVLVAARAAVAAQDDSEPGTLAANWPMERVTLADGKTFRGLIQAENPLSIDFLDVVRPPGKPMYLVVRPIPRKEIEDTQRLDSAQRQQLRLRLERYKRRTLVEGRRMEDLTLVASQRDGQTLWNFEGQWFTLESTADEAMTRRLIVRLGQIFTAYRQLFPPRFADGGRVHIRVFGDAEPYRAALEELGLAIRNPAVYLADRNVILAASELNRFDAELEAIGRQHAEIRRQFDSLVAEVPERVKKLGEDLKKNNVPAGDRLRILVAEQRKWGELRKEVLRKITALDRKNAAKFNEVTAQMFTRLAHEAFHAYLESFVYPRRAYDVPRWLNEGLAKTFEAGRLEVDSLRIDAPNIVALDKLQADLRGPRPLELRELLQAGSEKFLGGHEGNLQSASRVYYYSWGLAYYLAFEQGVLDDPALDEYLSPDAARLDPVARFEALVGTPLDEFQSRWREAMLALKPGT